MTTATLTHEGESIDIPLVEESGTPIFITDIGKPEQEFKNGGALDPRVSDFWSTFVNYTLGGRFQGSNAFDDAISLADMIKGNLNTEAITLDVDLPEVDPVEVAPSPGQDQALELTYEPGETDHVHVGLSLMRIGSFEYGTDQDANTPTASGSGPLQLTDGTTTVDLDLDLTVERTIGRPQSVARAQSNQKYPNYHDKRKTASDVFQIKLQFTRDAVTKTENIQDLISDLTYRGGLQLKFNGLYGMGTFDVAPLGGNALRTVRQVGQEGMVPVPTLNLRAAYVDG